MTSIVTDRPRPTEYKPPAPRPSRDRVYDHLTLAILFVLSIIIAFTFQDYGISTDEEVQNTYGKLLLQFYRSGLSDTRVFSYLNLYLYGGLFDLIAALIASFSPLPDFETRHLLCALFGVLAVIATWRLTRLLAGPRAGLWAVILLVLCPPFYGAMFNNTKDIPFAAGMTWLLYLSCRLVPSLPLPPLRLVVWLGVVAGASLGIRVGAILGGLYLLPVFALHTIGVASWGGWRASARFIATLILRLSPAVVIAAAFMALLWPWSVMAPGNILLAVQELTAFQIPTVLAGRHFELTNVPAIYVPVYLIVKLPETILLGLFAAAVAALAASLRNHNVFPTIRTQQWLLVVLAASAPVLYAVFTQPAIYNGLRHFLFIIPPLCVIAAGGVEQLFAAARKLAERSGVLIVACLLAASLIKDTATMALLHPHQYVYYNMLAGGVSGANGDYELDYWSNFTREAVDQLTEHLAAQNGGRLPDRAFRVGLCTSPWPLRAYAPPQFKITKDWRSADFVIATTNTNCHAWSDGKTIIEVARLGVVLGVVKDRRDLAASATNIPQRGR